MTGVEPAEGHDSRHCGGRTKRGTLCARPAGWGTDHPGTGRCKLHLGSTATHRKHAERVRTETLIGELVEKYHPGLDHVDPHRELLEVVAYTGAMRRALADLVGQLGAFGSEAYVERPIGPKGRELEPNYTPADPAGVYGPDHLGDGKPHVLVSMLRDFTMDNAKAAKLAIDAGIAERQVRIAEDQAQQLGAVLRSLGSLLIEWAIEWRDAADMERRLTNQLPEAIRRSIEDAGVMNILEGRVVE